MTDPIDLVAASSGVAAMLDEIFVASLRWATSCD